jgi:hypothetical protein
MAVLDDPCHINVRNEVVRVSAREHEYLDSVLGLNPLNQADEIADQFGSQKIHGRSFDFREYNRTFAAHIERLEIHRIFLPLPSMIRGAARPMAAMEWFCDGTCQIVQAKERVPHRPISQHSMHCLVCRSA